MRGSSEFTPRSPNPKAPTPERPNAVAISTKSLHRGGRRRRRRHDLNETSLPCLSFDRANALARIRVCRCFASRACNHGRVRPE
jgi:hypothetical protein